MHYLIKVAIHWFLLDVLLLGFYWHLTSTIQPLCVRWLKVSRALPTHNLAFLEAGDQK